MKTSAVVYAKEGRAKCAERTYSENAAYASQEAEKDLQRLAKTQLWDEMERVATAAANLDRYRATATAIKARFVPGEYRAAWTFRGAKGEVGLSVAPLNSGQFFLEFHPINADQPTRTLTSATNSAEPMMLPGETEAAFHYNAGRNSGTATRIAEPYTDAMLLSAYEDSSYRVLLDGPNLVAVSSRGVRLVLTPVK